MMVSRAECPECGAHVDYLSRDKGLTCECGEEMEFVGKVGLVYSSSNDVRPALREELEDLLDYKSKLHDEKQEAIESEDEVGAAYASGKLSGVIAGEEALKAALPDGQEVDDAA